MHNLSFSDHYIIICLMREGAGGILIALDVIEVKLRVH